MWIIKKRTKKPAFQVIANYESGMLVRLFGSKNTVLIRKPTSRYFYQKLRNNFDRQVKKQRTLPNKLKSTLSTGVKGLGWLSITLSPSWRKSKHKR